MKWIAIVVFLALLALFGWGYYLNRNPAKIGVHEGRLSPCPSTPNCVSSTSDNPVQAIEPFPVIEERGRNPIDTLARIINSMPRSKMIQKNDRYLHAEFRSRIFSFVDDLEFLFIPEEEVIHVRSASRVGYGDWSVNRQRVELIRDEYLKHNGDQ